MSDFKCPMCLDYPDNCPLNAEEDTRDHSADYYKGRTSRVRKNLDEVLAQLRSRRDYYEGKNHTLFVEVNSIISIIESLMEEGDSE